MTFLAVSRFSRTWRVRRRGRVIPLGWASVAVSVPWGVREAVGGLGGWFLRTGGAGPPALSPG